MTPKVSHLGDRNQSPGVRTRNPKGCRMSHGSGQHWGASLGTDWNDPQRVESSEEHVRQEAEEVRAAAEMAESAGSMPAPPGFSVFDQFGRGPTTPNGNLEQQNALLMRNLETIMKHLDPTC